ncbi:MAG: hypothetical protein Q8P02_02230 [Candidatus Micrarchaeota archaeon]|nr:hypothetical protein [Candidatus Micrarchaeota archaeon]
MARYLAAVHGVSPEAVEAGIRVRREPGQKRGSADVVALETPDFPLPAEALAGDAKFRKYFDVQGPSLSGRKPDIHSIYFVRQKKDELAMASATAITLPQRGHYVRGHLTPDLLHPDREWHWLGRFFEHLIDFQEKK